MENIFTETLNNGIRIIGEDMPHFHSMSMGVWIKAGSVYESDTERGISHFIEHMLFKGTKTRTAADIASQMDGVGGNLNAFTAKECTCFYAKVIDENTELAADILSDMIHNPLLDKADMDKEKKVVCEEILMNEDSPEDVAMEALCQLYFKGSPLALPILGTQESVNAFSSNDILAYMKKMYSPSNIVIACAGGFNRNELISLLNEKFAPRNAPQNTSPKAEGIKSSRIDKSEFVSITKDIEQSQICIALPGFSINEELQYPMLVISNLFGASMSSRLFQKIREERGLAYSIYSYQSSYCDTGYFSIYAGTSEASAKTVTELIFDELELLKNKGFSNDEFLRSKNQLKGSFILGQESSNAHASSLGKSLLLRDAVFSPEDVLNRLEKVTPDNCMEAIEKVIDFSRLGLVLVGRNSKQSEVEAIKKLVCK